MEAKEDNLNGYNKIIKSVREYKYQHKKLQGDAKIFTKLKIQKYGANEDYDNVDEKKERSESFNLFN